MIAALEIRNLVKNYKGSVAPAINNFSLSIAKGEIFGLLGPNGAGKTTLISIITGLVKADSGTIKLFGEETSSANITKIGLVPQEIALYPSLTATENLTFIGKMYGISGSGVKSKIQNWLEVMDLAAHKNKMVKAYSGGMKRRVNLIAALLHDPEIIILDEPTVGVDVQSRSVILDQLLQLNKSGKTILYTSHQMEEAEKICNSIGIIRLGKLECIGTPEELLLNTNSRSIEELFLTVTGKDLGE